MSTHIVDKLAAIDLGVGQHGQGIYLLAMESGDNNVVSNDKKRLRCRDWRPLAIGEHYECMRAVVEKAASWCGGCTRFNGNHSSLPETFIKVCRQLLNEAPKNGHKDAAFRITRSEITFPLSALGETAEGSHLDRSYKELVQLRVAPKLARREHFGMCHVFPFKESELGCFAELLPYGTPLWHHLEVHGILNGPMSRKKKKGCRIYG